jgi:uncharacterized damage-inducible protein DinB
MPRRLSSTFANGRSTILGMSTGLAEMLRYNRWANLTLLEACRGLSDVHLDAIIPGVAGSVRELLMHIIGGQQTFVLRTQGRQNEGELNRGSQWTGFDNLIAIARQTSDELIAIAQDLDEASTADLAWQGKSFRYPRRFFLVHAVAHGAEHRTEVRLAFAQQGVATPDLDAWQYAGAMGYGAEVVPGV